MNASKIANQIAFLADKNEKVQAFMFDLMFVMGDYSDEKLVEAARTYSLEGIHAEAAATVGALIFAAENAAA